MTAGEEKSGFGFSMFDMVPIGGGRTYANTLAHSLLICRSANQKTRRYLKTHLNA